MIEALDGRTMAWLSDATGISTSSLSEYPKGKKPSAEFAARIAEATGRDLQWLITGREPAHSPLRDRRGDFRGAPAETASEVEIIGIDQRYGLGGTFVDNPVEEVRMRFPLSWIRQVTDAPPEMLRWTAGHGDSMAPTIGDGDPILIDLRQTTIRSRDAIWAFAIGQIGGIKRLRPHSDGSVEILSDNPNVPPDRAGPEEELHIVGRVVAVVKRI